MSTTTTSAHARVLAEEKLASSGLTPGQLDSFGMAVVEDATALCPQFKARPALVLTYHDPAGAPMSSWPGHPPFYRVRYLGPDNSPAAVAGAKSPRYAQPTGTPPCAYYPRAGAWPSICADPSQTLILTEGELKAAAAVAAGFPTIGLGGVDSWRALKWGIEFLPSLNFVEWRGRRVIIVFDSDLRGNTSVARALRQLSERLTREGAYPHLVYLPSLPQCEKTGLDDFLVHCGSDALVELLQQAEPIGLSAVLWSLNERYTYVKDPGLVYSAKGQRISPSALRDHLESVQEYMEPTVQADGTIKRKPVSAGAAWLRWPMRAEADKLTYAPGGARMVDGELNIWPGWGSTPREGDVTPFLRLIDHLFTGADAGAKEWFLRWCAYPIQHPGTKLYTAAVVWGTGQGTGKSLIGYTLGRIYGRNFTEISHRDLDRDFNEWAIGKQFVMGDDVTSHERRRDADHIKKLITQTSIIVNQKFVPTYEVPDVVNYYITSNHPDALFLEDDDRRFFVHEVITDALPPEFYIEYDRWYKSEAGAAALHHYLLHLDLGDWNPRARAPRTEAKARMLLNGMSDVGLWVRQLLDSPDQHLRVGGVKLEADLYTSAQLLTIYDPQGRGKVGANGIARELGRAGVRQVAGGAPLKLADGSQGRFFAVRNGAKWMKATGAEVIAHLNEFTKERKAKF